MFLFHFNFSVFNFHLSAEKSDDPLAAFRESDELVRQILEQFQNFSQAFLHAF